MNIPRLWEAHRGVRVLQSAHRSMGVKRDEGKACWQGAYEVWDLLSRASLSKKYHLRNVRWQKGRQGPEERYVAYATQMA
jgi:hypothetical protein